MTLLHSLSQPEGPLSAAIQASLSAAIHATPFALGEEMLMTYEPREKESISHMHKKQHQVGISQHYKQWSNKTIHR